MWMITWKIKMSFHSNEEKRNWLRDSLIFLFHLDCRNFIQWNDSIIDKHVQRDLWAQRTLYAFVTCWYIRFRNRFLFLIEYAHVLLLSHALLENLYLKFHACFTCICFLHMSVCTVIVWKSSRTIIRIE